jgi:Domain found in Dishevelled, Egl-10, and Pleckstrin (DEP)
MTPFNVLIDIPAGTEQSAVVALCSAVGVKGTVVTHPNTKLNDTIAALVSDETRIACIDLARLEGSGLSIAALARVLLNEKVRARVMLINRLQSFSEPELQFLLSLGFAGICSNIDPSEPESELRVVAQWIARFASKIEQPSEQKMRTYMKAVPPTARSATPRFAIKQITKLTAEVCLAQIHQVLAIDDRRYHLQSFEQCFVGKDAVKTIAGLFKISTMQAVEVGRALQSMHCLYHVAHAQAFEEGDFYYRLNNSKKADSVSLQAALQTLKTNEASLVKDRVYGAKTYPQSFVGGEAVDALVNAHNLKRLDAYIVMQRLHNMRLFGHVVGEHAFEDGRLFYVFRR